MCTERPRLNDSFIKVFSRLKTCIVEAENPLVDIALGTLKYYVTRFKKGRTLCAYISETKNIGQIVIL